MNQTRHISQRLTTLCIVSALLIFGPFLGVSQAQDLPPEVIGYADTVLYNGQVLTMDRDQPPINAVQAIAIREGRIMAVGEDDRILRMAGPDTARVNLNGRTVIPGIVDTHSHPNAYAVRHYSQEVVPAYYRYLEESKVRLVTVRWESKETALSDFKRAAENLPPEYWVYATAGLLPTVLSEITRYDLDEVVPDHPLYVMVGNAMWGLANSKMLELVEETYGDNLPGLLRDENGVPNGRLLGAAGTVIDQEMIPMMPPEILKAPFKKELEEWVAIGVTTLSTRISGNEITAYKELEEQGELPLRLGYSHEIGRGNPFLERDLKRFGNLQGHGTPWMWMIGISMGIPDGNGPSGAGTACTTIAKRTILPSDVYPDGMCFWALPEDPSGEAAVIANRYGYRITGTHTFGDKGFTMILDSFDQAGRESSIEGQRFALDHGLMVSPEVLERAAEVGVIWSLQPPQFYRSYAANVSRVYGEEYAHRWVMPVKSIIDAGMRVTYGADVHDDPERQPMFNLEVMVTREIKDGRVFGPRESIDRATGLLMMTRWGAEYVLREDEVGSLEVGKLADLVLLDRNPLDRNLRNEDISEIKVLATMIDGKVVYGELTADN